jgi:LysM repeat protein
MSMSRRFVLALLVVAAVHIAVAAAAFLLYTTRRDPRVTPGSPAAREDFQLKPVNPDTPRKPEPRTHKVQPGDTYWGLAQKFNVSIEDLRKANGHARSHVLKPGEVLKIPSAGN